MTFENLTIERDGAVARLWLDRPEKLNALHRALWDSIPAAVASLDADPEVVYEAVPWMPRDTALPDAGASCLVVFDDRGNPWMPVWRPT